MQLTATADYRSNEDEASGGGNNVENGEGHDDRIVVNGNSANVEGIPSHHDHDDNDESATLDQKIDESTEIFCNGIKIFREELQMTSDKLSNLESSVRRQQVERAKSKAELDSFIMGTAKQLQSDYDYLLATVESERNDFLQDISAGFPELFVPVITVRALLTKDEVGGAAVAGASGGFAPVPRRSRLTASPSSSTPRTRTNPAAANQFNSTTAAAAAAGARLTRESEVPVLNHLTDKASPACKKRSTSPLRKSSPKKRRITKSSPKKGRQGDKVEKEGQGSQLAATSSLREHEHESLLETSTTTTTRTPRPQRSSSRQWAASPSLFPDQTAMEDGTEFEIFDATTNETSVDNVERGPETDNTLTKPNLHAENFSCSDRIAFYSTADHNLPKETATAPVPSTPIQSTPSSQLPTNKTNSGAPTTTEVELSSSRTPPETSLPPPPPSSVAFNESELDESELDTLASVKKESVQTALLAENCDLRICKLPSNPNELQLLDDELPGSAPIPITANSNQLQEISTLTRIDKEDDDEGSMIDDKNTDESGSDVQVVYDEMDDYICTAMDEALDKNKEGEEEQTDEAEEEEVEEDDTEDVDPENEGKLEDSKLICSIVRIERLSKLIESELWKNNNRIKLPPPETRGSQRAQTEGSDQQEEENDADDEGEGEEEEDEDEETNRELRKALQMLERAGRKRPQPKKKATAAAEGGAAASARPGPRNDGGDPSSLKNKKISKKKRRKRNSSDSSNWDSGHSGLVTGSSSSDDDGEGRGRNYLFGRGGSQNNSQPNRSSTEKRRRSADSALSIELSNDEDESKEESMSDLSEAAAKENVLAYDSDEEEEGIQPAAAAQPQPLNKQETVRDRPGPKCKRRRQPPRPLGIKPLAFSDDSGAEKSKKKKRRTNSKEPPTSSALQPQHDSPEAEVRPAPGPSGTQQQQQQPRVEILDSENCSSDDETEDDDLIVPTRCTSQRKLGNQILSSDSDIREIPPLPLRIKQRRSSSSSEVAPEDNEEEEEEEVQWGGRRSRRRRQPIRKYQQQLDENDDMSVEEDETDDEDDGQVSSSISDLNTDDENLVFPMPIPIKVEPENEDQSSEEGTEGEGEDEVAVAAQRQLVPKSLFTIPSIASASAPVPSSATTSKRGGRRNIRPIMADTELAPETIRAEQEEEEILKRLKERENARKAFDRHVLALPPALLPPRGNTATAEAESTVSSDLIVIAEAGPGLILDRDASTSTTLVEIHPGLAKHFRPHQTEGVEFLWSAVFDTQARAMESEGTGAILAHCMGLGKTLQVIGLLIGVLTNEKLSEVFKTALVVCPKAVANNWKREISHWQQDLPSKDHVKVHILSKSTLEERKAHLENWKTQGGIGLIHYEMFIRFFSNSPSMMELIDHKSKKNPANKPPTTTTNSRTVRQTSEEEVKAFKEWLLDPGPQILVLDEGHLLKNYKSMKYKLLKQVKTKRKIILTGTPLQNNLNEFYSMMDLVKPNLLGTRKEFNNRFMIPIENGQFKDSLEEDANIMKMRAHVLTKKFDSCVHRRGVSVLATQIPPKYEYVIYLNLTPLQIALNNYYLENKDAIRKAKGTSSSVKSGILQDYSTLMKIIAHPFQLQLAPRVDQLKNKQKKRSRGDPSGGGGGDDFDDIESVFDDVEDNYHFLKPGWHELIFSNSNEIMTNYELSGKLIVLKRILTLCEAIGDKVLVFSQFLNTLDLIEQMLATEHVKTTNATPGLLHGRQGLWKSGMDYFRLDGNTSNSDREESVKFFNSVDSKVKLYLICTRAGSLGINLIGASRVVVFDASWNPSHDLQGIFRAYRIGQKKNVHIYRFLGKNTMEDKIYHGQIVKLALANRVVDSRPSDRSIPKDDVKKLYEIYDEDETRRGQQPFEEIGKVIQADRLLVTLVNEHRLDGVNVIHSIRQHDSLLRDDELLTEEDKVRAMEIYDQELTNNPTSSAKRGATDKRVREATSGVGADGGAAAAAAGPKKRGRKKKAVLGGGSNSSTFPQCIWNNLIAHLRNYYRLDCETQESIIKEANSLKQQIEHFHAKASDTTLPDLERLLAKNVFDQKELQLSRLFANCGKFINLSLLFGMTPPPLQRPGPAPPAAGVEPEPEVVVLIPDEQ